MKNLLKTSLFIFILTSFLVSCTSPEKLVRQGDYDDAIQLAVKKLVKKNQKDSDILALEKAFSKSMDRDMRRITSLKKEGQPDNWTEINSIFKRVQKRQGLVERVIPLYVKSEGDREAVFEFVKADDLELESREKAAEFLYASAQKNMDSARQGDKMAARKAWDELNKTKKYYRNYKDRSKLMDQAKTMGTNHVFFKMKNSSGAVLPPGFEKELLQMSVRELDSDWVKYTLTRSVNKKFDYNIIANISKIQVSPEQEKQKEYVDEKEIDDGFDYVKDEDGNVKKDENGNDIKVARKKTIKADIVEVHQFKSAKVGGRLEYYENKSGELIKTIPITSEAIFENYASTFRGDKRALSSDTKNKLGNKPLPFPSNPDLLLTAAEELKPIIREAITGNQTLVGN